MKAKQNSLIKLSFADPLSFPVEGLFVFPKIPKRLLFSHASDLQYFSFPAMITSIVDDKFHFQTRMIVSVCGIAWAAVTYSYAGSIIATTLGEPCEIYWNLNHELNSSGQPTFYEYMGLATNPHEAALIGATTGLFYAGGIFGAVLNSIICDRIGRKWTAITAQIIVVSRPLVYQDP
jgi:hypothetical protein